MALVPGGTIESNLIRTLKCQIMHSCNLRQYEIVKRLKNHQNSLVVFINLSHNTEQRQSFDLAFLVFDLSEERTLNLEKA